MKERAKELLRGYLYTLLIWFLVSIFFVIVAAVIESFAIDGVSHRFTIMVVEALLMVQVVIISFFLLMFIFSPLISYIGNIIEKIIEKIESI